MIRSTLISSLMLVSAVLTIPAAAQVRASESRVTVSTDGLDVASDAGHAAFQARIHQAVTRACGTLHTRSTAELQNNLACTRQAQMQANAQAERVVADAQSHRQVAMTK